MKKMKFAALVAALVVSAAAMADGFQNTTSWGNVNAGSSFTGRYGMSMTSGGFSGLSSTQNTLVATDGSVQGNAFNFGGRNASGSVSGYAGSNASASTVPGITSAQASTSNGTWSNASGNTITTTASMGDASALAIHYRH